MRWLFFLLFFLPLSATDEIEIKDLPLSNQSSGLSAIVNKSVNVISGHFLDSATDLTVICPEEFNFERHYCSKDYGFNSLYHSWSHNWYSYIKRDPRIDEKNQKYYLYDKSGSSMIFNKSAKDPKPLKHAILFRTAENKGTSNVGSGIISARTNMKNLNFVESILNYQLIMPDGTKRIYLSDRKASFLKLEEKPNGNKTIYEYENHGLKEVTLCNQAGDTMAWFSVEKAGNEKFNHKPVIKVKSSDQRTIRYKFQKVQSKKAKRFYLTEVKTAEHPPESYEYDFKVKALTIEGCLEVKSTLARITAKHRPDSRYLLNEYYTVGDKHADIPIPLNEEKHDLWLHRVKKQLAPLGTDNTPIVAYQFHYFPNIDKNTKKQSNGYTHVYDAYGNLTKYYYDTEHRLLQVARPGQRERFHWGTGKDDGNLVDHFFDDSSNNVLFSRHYSYDDRGNVLKDTFRGNITGLGVEEFSQQYTYSNNGLNLMLTQDNGLEKYLYQYVPGKNLLSAKFTLVNGKIVAREFYEYDNSSCLLCKIKDDGTTSQKENLIGATERAITRYVRKNSIPCWGAPLVIEEKYLDFDTGQECLLKKLVQEFDGYGRMVAQKVYGSDGQYAYTLTWAYNDMGNVIREVDALGNATARKFDANGNMLEEESLASGYKKLCYYDFCNRKIRENIQTPAGELLGSAFEYNYLNQCVAEYDVCGNKTRIEMDCHGRVNRKTYPDGSQESFSYDDAGNQIAATDQRGFTTYKQYNARGQPIFISYPDGTAETYTYNLWGAVVSHTAKNGTVTKYTRDHQHRILSETIYDSSGACLKTTTNTYNAFHLLNTLDPDGNLITYNYDAAGRLIQICKNDELTEYAYDSLGRQNKIISHTTDQEAAVTCYEYDNLDQKIEERLEDKLGNVLKKVCYLYDARGNQIQEIKHTAAGPAITKTAYNLFNQPSIITDPLGNSKHIAYNYKCKDAYGRYVQQQTETDPLGQQTISTFDTMGRIVSVVKKNSIGYELAKVEKQYDLSGNCIASIDTIYSQNGQRRVMNCWEYDSLNRVTAQIEASGLPEQKITRYAYNASGEKEIIVKPDGITLTHTYDALGLLQQLASSDGTIHYRYTYSPSGLPTQVEDLVNNTITIRTYYKGRLQQETLGNGLAIGYEYDRIGRPTTVILPDQTTVEYTYDPCYLRQITRNGLTHRYSNYDLSGNLLEEHCPNGSILTTSYDLLGRPLTAPLQDDICYDQAGNLISYKQEGETLNFGYDDLYQLNKEKDHSYQFDSLYNRVSKDNENYTYNGLNQIVSEDMAYDFNGNLIRQGNAHYTYDALDRLIKVDGKTTTTYCYDSFNRRLSKETLIKNTLCRDDRNEPITYFYQGQDETGACQNGKVINLRLLGRGKGAEIGANVLIEINQTPYIPLHDHNGSIIRLLDLKGRTVESYHYTAYGEETVTNSSGSAITPVNPWRFSSKRTDEETGFVYFGRRYYSPVLARWVTADPIGFDGGPNLYAYVLNSPLTRVDLYGLYPEFGHRPPPEVLCFGMRDIFYYVGKALEFLFHNFIPVPHVNDIFSGVGRLMAGEGFSFKCADYGHSCSYVLPGESYDDHKLCYGNGICNTPNEAREGQCHVRTMFGNYELRCCYNETDGILADIAEAGMEKLGYESCATRNQRATLMDAVNDAGGPGKGMATSIVFSKGGIYTYHATKSMSDEYRQSLNIVTLGSAKMIPNSNFRRVINYVSLADPVPFLCDPIGILRGIFTKSVTIKFLWPSCKNFFDHQIKSKTYEQALEKEAQIFHNRGRK